MDVHGGETAKQLFWDGSKSQTGMAWQLPFGPQDHTALGYVVVSQNRGTPNFGKTLGILGPLLPSAGPGQTALARDGGRIT